MKDGKLQRIIILQCCLVACVYALEGLWADGAMTGMIEKGIRFLTGGSSGCFLLYLTIKGRSFRKKDCILLYSLLTFAFFSSWSICGFSFQLFFSAFYFTWLSLIWVYLAMKTIKNPDALMRWVSLVFVMASAIATGSVVVRATVSLKAVIPGNDRIFGCFKVGRLCGFGNANIFSMHCMTAFLFSLLGLIKWKGKIRILFGAALIWNWFCLGLANTRTCILATAFTIGVWCFGCMHARLAKEKVQGRAGKELSAILLAALVAIMLLPTFLAPAFLYKGAVKMIAGAVKERQMVVSLERVYSRDAGDLETLTDRTKIWRKSLETSISNERRFWIGTSVKSNEQVNGVYEGRHDIVASFSHNMFLEVLRRLGVIGLGLWILLIVTWGEKAIKTLLDPQEDSGSLFLMAMGAGTLLTGITECGPFPIHLMIAIPLPFFLCCGYCMREKNEKA